MSSIIFYRMQAFDGIILKKKVRYLDPAAIWEAKHVSPKWMKDDDDHLKSFKTKKAKQKERKRFHQVTFTNVAAYISLSHDGKTWMSYLRHTTSSKSNVNHFIINHCSDPCLQNVHNIFFRNHWIAFHIQPKLWRILVLDSLDWSTKRYQEFLDILQLWVNFLSFLSMSCLPCSRLQNK